MEFRVIKVTTSCQCLTCVLIDKWHHLFLNVHKLRAGLHYGGEGFRSVKNAWPRRGYMRQMVDMPEKN